MSSLGLQIAVIGGATADDSTTETAFRIGAAIGRSGATLLCGGRGGVMLAAAEGARSVGGATVGILPGIDTHESPPNPYIQTAIFTGMGQARNQILVLSADAVIGCGGGWGTLSEIGIALKHRRPTILVDSWHFDTPADCSDAPLFRADSPEEAVRQALEQVRKGTRS